MSTTDHEKIKLIRLSQVLRHLSSGGISQDQIARDVLFLLDQIATLGHLQDTERLNKIRRRYGWDY